MTSQTVYGRVVKLSVLSTAGAPLLLEGFDVDAKVEQSATESTANKTDIVVINLPREMRSAFQKPGTRVTLSAGYKNTIAMLGTYDVRRAYSQLEGPDWMTYIECAENIVALRDAQFSSTFPAGVSKSTVAKQVIAPLLALGVGRGNFDETLGALPGTYPNGICLDARVSLILNDLCRLPKLAFSIQNGELCFLEANTTLKKTITLSPDTGLIGLPEFSEGDPENKKPPQIKCRSLLRSDARAGMGLFIDLPKDEGFVRGKLKINKLVHNFSTYAQSFYTDFECEAVS